MIQTTKTKTIKKYKLFYKGLASALLVCMACLLLFLVWFWGFLQRYEASSPEAALNEFSALVKAENYTEIFNRGNYIISKFNTKEVYHEFLKETLPKDAAINYNKITSANAEKRYQAYIDEKPVGIISLKEPQEQGMPYAAYFEVEGTQKITITAPQIAKVYVDGKLLQNENIVKQTSVPYFEKLAENLRPTRQEYMVDGLLKKPIVTAQANDGFTCELKEDDEQVSIIVVPGGQNEKNYSELITAAAKIYAALISRDATFAQLKSLSVADTDFIVAMQHYSNVWFIDHNSFEFENIKVDTLEQLSDDVFTGEISFDYKIKEGKNLHIFPTHYKMTFLKVDGKYKLLNLTNA